MKGNTVGKDKKRAEVFRLVQDCSDLTLPRERLADLLSCDDGDIETKLDEMGLECCNACGIWKSSSDCSVEDPDEAGEHICSECAAKKGFAPSA